MREYVSYHPAKITSFGSCILANFLMFVIYVEYIFSSINPACYGFANFLAKMHCFFASLIKLTTRYQVRYSIRKLIVQTVKEIIFTISTKCFCCDGKSYYFNIREFRYSTTTNNISLLINMVLSKLFAYIKNFSELCNEVVHNNE